MPKCGSTTIIDIIDALPDKKFHWLKYVYPKEVHYLRNRTNDRQIMLRQTGKYDKMYKFKPLGRSSADCQTMKVCMPPSARTAPLMFW